MLNDQLENVFLTRLTAVANWCRKNSLWPMPFATACCGIELMATGASRHDIARFGADAMRFTPRQCDLMIVAGGGGGERGAGSSRALGDVAGGQRGASVRRCFSTGGAFGAHAAGP